MSLEDLGNIGDFVGAIGVVLSLVYLAVQIRQNSRQVEQNTRSVRSASFHVAHESIGAYASSIAEDEALAELLERGLRGAELSSTERVRFDALFSRLFSAYEELFYLQRDSLVDSELWASRARNLSSYLRQPGGRDYWGRMRGLFAESFREFVDQQLREGPAA